MKIRITFSIWLGICVFWGLSSAQNNKESLPLKSDDLIKFLKQYVIPRIHEKVILDGMSNEPAWKNIKPLDFVMHRPHFGQPPSEKTEVLIAYDEEYLYVAGRLYDQEPDKIQANSKKRDSSDPSSEWFGIVLDTFNDKENAVAFFTTPTGLRWDSIIFNDAEGDDPKNVSWNTFWNVATEITHEGWFVEMRIPFSSLRFQSHNGRVTMGLLSWRLIARKNEFVIFPPIPPNWGFYSIFKPSQAQEIILEDVQSHTPLYVSPYFLGGIGQSYIINVEETHYHKHQDIQKEMGLDMKYGLTSNLTLDVTLNTDFAQVEADDQQVNLTRFSLFYPEKRLFFQERSGIFDFNFESSEPNRLFYSRRIGIADDKTVPIYGGARLVGRIGSWDLGFLNMQTASMHDVPSHNFGVLRLRSQVFNPYSYVGGIATSKIGNNGSYNVAYGLDGIIRTFDDVYLTLKWAQTFENERANNPFSLSPSRVRFNLQKRSNKGFGYGFSYSRAGVDYNPGIGFEMRKNYTRYASGVWYGWFPSKPSHFIFRHQLYLSGGIIHRNEDGLIECAQIGPVWQCETKSGYNFFIQPQYIYENVPDTFFISDDAVVPIGKYAYSNIIIEFSLPTNRSFSLGSTFNDGTFYDGKKLSLEFSPRWSVSSSLELEGSYEWNRVRFSKRHQRFDAHIARVRALYMMSTQCFASAFVQYNSAANKVFTNFRFRYNPREGVDFYLVYNECLNTDKYREIPFLPKTENRTILLKYTYTFVL